MSTDIDFIEKSGSLAAQIKGETPIKDFLVNYVGNNNSNVQKDNVTVENIIETLSEEFPEFILALAEENWVRGYHQALIDIESGDSSIANEQ